MGCSNSAGVKPIPSLRLEVMPVITFGVPKQSVPNDISESGLQLVCAEPQFLPPPPSQHTRKNASSSSLVELDDSTSSPHGAFESVESVRRKPPQFKQINMMAQSYNAHDGAIIGITSTALSPDYSGRRSTVKSSTQLNSPGKGLGYILECESILEASMKGDEEQRSKSRATLRRQSSSALRAESKSKATKQSIFKPQIHLELHSKNREPSVESSDDSSDSGIPEYTENNASPQNDLLHVGVNKNEPKNTSNNSSPNKIHCSTQIIEHDQTKLVKLPSLYLKNKQLMKQKAEQHQKSRDDLTRNSQRRSLTIERERDNLGSVAHGLFSSESII